MIPNDPKWWKNVSKPLKNEFLAPHSAKIGHFGQRRFPKEFVRGFPRTNMLDMTILGKLLCAIQRSKWYRFLCVLHRHIALHKRTHPRPSSLSYCVTRALTKWEKTRNWPKSAKIGQNWQMLQEPILSKLLCPLEANRCLSVPVRFVQCYKFV